MNYTNKKANMNVYNSSNALLATRIILIAFFVFLSYIYISTYKTQIQTQIQIHSSDLYMVTSYNQQEEKIDYVDSNGTITMAANLGYATKVITYDNMNRIEKYYDEKGLPICRLSGYYAVLREYNDEGNNVRNTYLDANQNPVLISDGYAMEEKEYNDNHQVENVRYYDATGHGIQTKMYGHGRRYEYDDDGRIIRITNIDDKGKPFSTNLGYASVEQRYYEIEESLKWKVEREMYFDTDGNPTQLALGQYGIHKEYDDKGRAYRITYLDKYGYPILNNLGYATIQKTFRNDNSVEIEKYYDLNGNQVSLSEGQYGVKREKNRTLYININSEEIFNIRNLIYNNPRIVIFFSVALIVLSIFTNKTINVGLLVICILSIIYLTLLLREKNELKNIGLLENYKRLFEDSETRASIIKNIWLFIPLGAMLYRLCPRKIVILFPIILSISIELAQLYMKIGFCELDDVVSNSLGGIIGFILGKMTYEIYIRIKKWKDIHSLQRGCEP